MRLTAKEAALIREAALEHFGPDVSVWLFGSRVDDAKRGGDIDIYIESDRLIPDRVLKICRLFATLQMRLGEQKIDILVRDPGVEAMPIHRIAKQTGVPL